MKQLGSGVYLQIPRPQLLSLSRRGYSLEALAEHFHASEEMVRFRRNMTGVQKLLVPRNEPRAMAYNYKKIVKHLCRDANGICSPHT